eukprot:scaffold120282_cov39-Phaeocystis_antarctica.AAC.2
MPNLHAPLGRLEHTHLSQRGRHPRNDEAGTREDVTLRLLLGDVDALPVALHAEVAVGLAALRRAASPRLGSERARAHDGQQRRVRRQRLYRRGVWVPRALLPLGPSEQRPHILKGDLVDEIHTRTESQCFGERRALMVRTRP